MAYRLRCDYCKHTFLVHSRTATCPKGHGRSRTTTVIEEVLDTAADVATAYFMVDVASDVISGVGDLIGSMFD